MATIGETIDLDVPIGVARKKWNEYVSGMVTGSGLGPGRRRISFPLAQGRARSQPRLSAVRRDRRRRHPTHHRA